MKKIAKGSASPTLTCLSKVNVESAYPSNILVRKIKAVIAIDQVILSNSLSIKNKMIVNK